MSDETGADQQPPEETDINAQKRNALVVPGNILPWIEAASNATGIPRDLLAAIIYQHSGFIGLTPGLVMQVAEGIGEQFDTQGARFKYPDEQEISEEAWLDAAAAWAYGTTDSAAAQAYRAELNRVYAAPRLVREMKGGKATGDYVTSTGTGITLGRDKALPSGKFTTARFPGGLGGKAAYGPGGAGGGPALATGDMGRRIAGLTPDQETAAHSIADSLYIGYLGRLPTDDEYRNIIKRKLTQDTLEDYLRAQPNPNAPGTTVGEYGDMKTLATKAARETLGREPTAGEINFLITNKVPASSLHVGAYYEQIRDHAVWRGDPDKWRDMRDRLQRVWNSLGLTGTVDPNTVNEALGSNWTEDQAGERFRAMPAPGYAQGVTVGDVDRARQTATSFKRELFPGEPVTEAEVKQLIGLSPDEMRNFYRSMPSKNVPGVQAGPAEDYKSIASQLLKQYGIVGRDPTPEEIRLFVLGKYDTQKIIDHYGDDPALVALQPGLPYGMSHEDYNLAVQGYGEALTGVYGKSPMALAAAQPPKPGAPQQGDLTKIGGEGRDQTLTGYALRRRISAKQFGDVVSRFQTERGRLPTVDEFGERMNRPEDVFIPYRGQVAEPSVRETQTGPVAAGAEERGSPRPAL